MVQMQADGQTGLNLGGFHQLDQIGTVGIGPCPLGHLENHWGITLPGSLGDTLDDLHIVNVKGADGVPAVISLFEHFGGCDNRHDTHSL